MAIVLALFYIAVLRNLKIVIPRQIMQPPACLEDLADRLLKANLSRVKSVLYKLL